MFERSGWVVSEGQLVKLTGVPADLFSWFRFQDSMLDEAAPVSAGAKGLLDSAVVSPGCRVDGSVVGSLAAVSEELLQLFDTYSIPFAASISDRLTYQSEDCSERVFRLMVASELPQVVKGFPLLLRVWLDTYASVSSVVSVNSDELVLLRKLLVHFVNATTSITVGDAAWDVDWKRLVFYLLTPESRRGQFSLSQQETSKRLMEQFGYHHVW